VIGSRYCPGGGIEGWPLRRKIASRLINTLARTMIGLPLSDCSGNYRLYRTELLAKLQWKNLHAAGYAYLSKKSSGIYSSLEPISQKYQSFFLNDAPGNRRLTSARCLEQQRRSCDWRCDAIYEESWHMSTFPVSLKSIRSARLKHQH